MYDTRIKSFVGPHLVSEIITKLISQNMYQSWSNYDGHSPIEYFTAECNASETFKTEVLFISFVDR